MNSIQCIHLNFDYMDKHYEGEAIHASSKHNSLPAFDIFFDNEYNGTIVKTANHWSSDNHFDSGLISVIGSIL